MLHIRTLASTWAHRSHHNMMLGEDVNGLGVAVFPYRRVWTGHCLQRKSRRLP